MQQQIHEPSKILQIMENKNPSPAKYSITFGIINGSFGIILGLMLYALDMHYQNDPIVQIIAALVGIFIIMFGIIQFKNENKGFLNLSGCTKVRTWNISCWRSYFCSF